MGEYLQVEKEFILKLYEALGQTPDDIDNLSQDDLKKLSEELHDKIAKDDVAQALAAFSSSEIEEATNTFSLNSGEQALDLAIDISDVEEKQSSVLIIDDLGVITYQLNQLFAKNGFQTKISQEIFDAMEKFKNFQFDWVIMDLFIPTEREGLMLLNELKKLISVENRNTKVAIISASNKKEHKKICLERGADFFIEKALGWQKILTEQCMNL